VREADHSPESIAEVKIYGGIPPLPNTSSDIIPDLVSRGNKLMYKYTYKQTKTLTTRIITTHMKICYMGLSSASHITTAAKPAQGS
jgi:hypothetical protein